MSKYTSREILTLDPRDFVLPDRDFDKVFLHCSANSSQSWNNVEAIRKYHMEERGWSDIGYHFFITFEGVIQVGRSIDRTPAAQKGLNKGTVAICTHGLKSIDFTKESLEATKSLCAAINEEKDGNITFHGHCEVANKSCPVYDYKRLLDLDEQGNMGIGGNLDSSQFDRYPVTKIGDMGDVVFILQKLLDIKNADGVFGSETQKHVIDFQKEIGLEPDGISGMATWAELV